jgi:hypothetical protein
VSAAVPERWTAHAFRGEVTRIDISDRYQAGATVQVVTAPVPPETLLLAAVSPDGDVDLEATIDGADPDDTLIALVDAG